MSIRLKRPSRAGALREPVLGGTYRNRLFMVASTSLYSLYVNARGAIEAGAMLAIDTDAHSTGELELIFYGVDVARHLL